MKLKRRIRNTVRGLLIKREMWVTSIVTFSRCNSTLMQI